MHGIRKATETMAWRKRSAFVVLPSPPRAFVWRGPERGWGRPGTILTYPLLPPILKLCVAISQNNTPASR